MDSRSFAAPAMVFAAVLAMGPGSGVVQCRTAWQPARAASVSNRTGLPVDRVRLFAPTRQAVFFSRAGDRCAWRGGGPARG